MVAALLLTLVGALDLPYVATGAEPVPTPHFPSRLHAYVWRNWLLVPADRLAEVVGATPEEIVDLGHRMGLSGPPRVPRDRFERAYISVIRANWALLPDDDLLRLLGWTPERLAFALREDDFLYGKMGVRPALPPLRYEAPTPAMREREDAISATVREHFPNGVGLPEEPLFGFVDRLTEAAAAAPPPVQESLFSPRFTYSYFAVYGDVLLDADPFPDGMLARLAEVGVDGVWIQSVLHRLAPFPWDPSYSARCEERMEHLRRLIARAERYGIGVYLYLNEPRSLPLAFFEGRAHLMGVKEAGYGRLCTSVPEVQDYLRDAVAHVCRSAPGLRGFFTITVGENRTLCWSHLDATGCPRCAARSPQEVVAEACRLIQDGIDAANSGASLIVWDWAWPDDWFDGILPLLPKEAAVMSVSEWGLELDRGGGPVAVTEYAMSVVGPSPRATRRWAAARAHGLKTIAKIQASTTWELSTVPYLPAFRNVATHVGRLRDAGVDGLMLSWTVGAYPSAGYEIASAMGGADRPSPEEAMLRVAERRFGATLAPAVVAFWTQCSDALEAYPFHNHPLYLGPVQLGPANPLWERATGYRATMVGFPYDDLARWRAMYPAETYADRYGEMAEGFERAMSDLAEAARDATLDAVQTEAFAEQQRVTQACALHFRSAANQARFVLLRRSLEHARGDARDGAGVAPADEAAFPDFADKEALATLDRIEAILLSERDLAVALHEIQRRDARIGFEASNQYHYTPMDLAEKVLNVEDLRTRWLPDARRKNYYAPNWWAP